MKKLILARRLLFAAAARESAEIVLHLFDHILRAGYRHLTDGPRPVPNSEGESNEQGEAEGQATKATAKELSAHYTFQFGGQTRVPAPGP